MQKNHFSYWNSLWEHFKKQKIGLFALYTVFFFSFIALYAPFLASSKPLFVIYDGEFFFPLFRYLFYTGFFTKPLDIFFNLLGFTLPTALLMTKVIKSSKYLSLSLLLLSMIQLSLFSYLMLSQPKNPESDIELTYKRRIAGQSQQRSWDLDLNHMSPYAKLNLVLRYQQHPQQYIQIKTDYGKQRLEWLEKQTQKIYIKIMPLLRPFHWEEDTGEAQNLNKDRQFWQLIRINHKDLSAALIFGTRISLTVGLLSVGIALVIAIPVGAFSGFYGGTLDIIVSRLLEVWESMPTFFMLLMIVAVAQSKSIFLVITVIGLFGWTSFSRYLRGEFFKQRRLAYVEACYALGYSDYRIIFIHILPNAIPPLLTLLPFTIMGAITGEAGLSFLGLGEENSCSWGVLMDEGRAAFPAQSELLWPPAILLTFLLIAIALVGDALRDTLDPKLRV